MKQSSWPHSLILGAAIAALVASAPGASRAQSGPLQVTRYTTEDGLGSNSVLTVARDRTGFLWIATTRDVQRFDGYSFVSYRTLDPGAPPELFQAIAGLFIDRADRLWVATLRAIFRIDPRSRNMVRVDLTDGFTAWAPDSSGRLWIVDGAVLKWLRADASDPVFHTASSPECAFCHAIAASHDGRLWLSRRRNGRYEVVRLDPSTGEAQTYPSEARYPITRLLEDAAGRLWLGGENGIATLDAAGQVRHLRQLQHRGTAALALDRAGGVFIATDDWLVYFDSAQTIRQRWTSPELFGKGLLPVAVVPDGTDGMWMATVTGGLIRLTTARPVFDFRSSSSVPALPFASDFITALLEQRDGSLWVGTLRGGAYRVSSDWSGAEVFRHDPNDPSSLASDEVWDFAEDADGNLWVGTAAGLCRWQRPRYRCFRTPDVVADIARDEHGTFWLASGLQGVLAFDPLAERFAPRLGIPGGTDRVEQVITVFVDRGRDALWFGQHRLYRATMTADAASQMVREVRKGQQVFQLHRDRHGRLWAASADGLLRANDADDRFDAVDIPEVRQTTVFSIAEDARGRLWLGTMHGLVRYSPEEGAASRYGMRDGFRSGELNRRASLVLRDGTIAIGGVLGLTRFDPEAVLGSRTESPVVLTRWRKMTPAGPVEEFLDGRDRIRLERSDRAFTMEFAALDFTPAISRRYRYRLQGLSDDWIETTDRLATFGAPKPGRYTFEVQTATGSEGRWSPAGSAIRLDVVPPFWATVWFRASMLAAALVLVWMLHRLRLRQALATERLRLRISRDLHDELGAGLSSIALLSDSAAGTVAVTDATRTELRRIGEFARDMVANLRDIVWAIDPEADRLHDIVTRMRDVAGSLLPHVRVSFDAPPAAELSTRIEMSMRRDLLLLYKELLHNVARHARASEVRIELAATRDAITLTVADDGVGFEPSVAGSGTGLRSLRERAARLGGSLEMRSSPGKGTSARLELKRT